MVQRELKAKSYMLAKQQKKKKKKLSEQKELPNPETA